MLTNLRAQKANQAATTVNPPSPENQETVRQTADGKTTSKPTKIGSTVYDGVHKLAEGVTPISTAEVAGGVKSSAVQLQRSAGEKAHPFDAVICDLDGVICATQKIHFAAWADAFNETLAFMGQNLDALVQKGVVTLGPSFDKGSAFNAFSLEDYRKHVDGKERMAGTREFFHSRGIELTEGNAKDTWNPGSAEGLSLRGVSNLKNDRVVTLIASEPPEALGEFKSTTDLLRQLKNDGVKIGLYSSSKNAVDILRKLGVLDIFDPAGIVTGHDIPSSDLSKPEPWGFLEAAKRLGTNPVRSVVFEDAQSGVMAGDRGGFTVVGLDRTEAGNTSNANAKALAQNGADIVVRDVKDLSAKVLDKVVSRKVQGSHAEELSPSRTITHPSRLEFRKFDPQAELHTEVLTALGNGYLGQRSSLASMGLGPVGDHAFYVAGLFNKPDGEMTSDLVNLPSWSSLELFDGEDHIDLSKGEVLQYGRNLDMMTGVLNMDAVWKSPHGRITRINIQQFTSQEDAHVGAARFSVTPLNYDDTVLATSKFDEKVTNHGRKHLQFTGGGADEQTRVSSLRMKTNQSGFQVNEAVRLDVNGPKGVPTTLTTSTPEKGKGSAMNVEAFLHQGQTITIDKIAHISTSRPGDQLTDSAAAVAKATTFDELSKINADTWSKAWKQCDVRIGGSMEDQQAIRFSIYHLRALGNGSGGHTSIAAKGLSNTPGEGYRGHVFWDTELFMLPFFAQTHPEEARNLLMYRYNTLEGAKKKAQDLGCEGVAFAWESTVDGSEETPKEVPLPDGGTVRIWCGDRELHITGDVALAVSNYVDTTGDRQFMKDHGAELLLQTARFWASFAKENNKGEFELIRVIGPDEFHEGPSVSTGEEGGVDNNVYTNAIAKWNIRKAITELNAMPEADRNAVLARAGMAPQEYADWTRKANRVADNIKINFDPDTGLFEQFDGYFKLEDPTKHPEWHKENGEYITHAMDAHFQGQGHKDRAMWTQINKQADVAMALALGLIDFDELGRKYGRTFDPQRIFEINERYYAERTSHGSSLSDSSFARLALWAGDMGKALHHFDKAKNIDIGDEKGNSKGGIHSASLGGHYQGVVNGFGGYKASAEGVTLAPQLPPSWTQLVYTVSYRGVPMEVTATQDKVNVHTKEGAHVTEPIKITVSGKNYKLSDSKGVTVALPGSGQKREPAKVN